MKRIILSGLIFFNVINILGQLPADSKSLTSDSALKIDVSANYNELLIPKLTTAARKNIAKPATGTLVFDLNYRSYFLYDGLAWLSLPGVDHANIRLDNMSAEAALNDKFGYATGIDSLYAIVGAPFHNDSLGATYIYKKRGNVWSQMSEIAPDTNCIQLFGASVSIDYPYAVVGAPAYKNLRGAFYIFQCNGSDWKLLSKFENPVDSDGKAQFGNSVDIDGSYIVAGAPFADNIAKAGGAAFVYKLGKNGWLYQNILTDSGIHTLDNFGFSVAVADSFIIVGSPMYDNGTNKDEGVAYKYKLNNSGNSWAIQSILHPFYEADVFSAGKESLSKMTAISDKWIYKKFGYSVDIAYNKTGDNSYEKIFTAIGAPESYYKSENMRPAENMGLIDIFTAYPDIPGEQNSMVIFNKESPDETDKDELLGASLSFSKFTGNLLNETGALDLQLLCGSPGYKSGNGKISRYSIDKVVELASVPSETPGRNSYEFSWTKNYKASLQSVYTESNPNAATGFSCSMFDANSYIVSLPGLNLKGGGIIFKF